ncbi:hypothetical protein [Neobacillus niacini]|uniref:hypothetical protein n=1 Tax=Neobacillus niacini TaxID=86668 RepID=UPI003983A3CA
MPNTILPFSKNVTAVTKEIIIPVNNRKNITTTFTLYAVLLFFNIMIPVINNKTGPIIRYLNMPGVAKQYKLSGSAQREPIMSKIGFNEKLEKPVKNIGSKYMIMNEFKTSRSALVWV